MESWKFVCLFVALIVVCTKASPLPKKAAEERQISQAQKSIDSPANSATQDRRQGRQFGFNYPYGNPFDYYNAYYSDYSNPEYYNPYRRTHKQKQAFKRRQYQGYRGTTQRYSVWDLSRK